MTTIFYDSGSDNPKEVDVVTFSTMGIHLRLVNGAKVMLPLEMKND